MAPTETENNAYANFLSDQQVYYGMLWYFLWWSTVECYHMTSHPPCWFPHHYSGS